MKIEEHIPLFLNEAYLYDIVSCHYQILKKYNLITENIEVENKEIRNIQIGKMMRNNPKLTSFLRNVTKNSIDNFISSSNIQSDSIILRQYDGIITKTSYKCIPTDSISPELRQIFQPMIISFDRKSYIAIDENDNIIAKGISERYDYLNNIYKKILKINYSNLESIFRNLQKIKDALYNEDDLLYFCIPLKDNKYAIHFKYYGRTEISEGTISMLDRNDIDIDMYFNMYVKPFAESIVISFLR